MSISPGGCVYPAGGTRRPAPRSGAAWLRPACRTISYDYSESKRYLDTLSNLVQSEYLIERIIDYFYIDADEEFVTEAHEIFPSDHIMVGHQILNVPDIEDAYLFGIMQALVKSKANIGKDVPTKLRKLRTKPEETEYEEEDY